MIVIRLATYASLMVAGGAAAFRLYALQPDERLAIGRIRWDGAINIAMSVALVASIMGAWIGLASMGGTGLTDVDPDLAKSVLLETDFGYAAIARIGVLALTCLAAYMLRRDSQVSFRSALVLVGAGSGLMTLIWTGHAGAAEGSTGSFHRVADIVHMIAAMLWIGAIVGFLILLSACKRSSDQQPIRITARALDQFSPVGTQLVAILVITGLINSQFLVGLQNLSALWSTSYGVGLLVKLFLFLGMLGLAAYHRWSLTPKLANHDYDGETPLMATLSAVQRSIALEFLLGLSVLGLVAWFGTLEPPISSITT